MPLNATDTDQLTKAAEAYVNALRAHVVLDNSASQAKVTRLEKELLDTAANYVRPIAPTETLINKAYDAGQIHGYRAHSNIQTIYSAVDGRPLR